jgi:hypothetical protein
VKLRSKVGQVGVLPLKVKATLTGHLRHKGGQFR